MWWGITLRGDPVFGVNFPPYFRRINFDIHSYKWGDLQIILRNQSAHENISPSVSAESITGKSEALWRRLIKLIAAYTFLKKVLLLLLVWVVMKWYRDTMFPTIPNEEQRHRINAIKISAVRENSGTISPNKLWELLFSPLSIFGFQQVYSIIVRIVPAAVTRTYLCFVVQAAWQVKLNLYSLLIRLFLLISPFGETIGFLFRSRWNYEILIIMTIRWHSVLWWQ